MANMMTVSAGTAPSTFVPRVLANFSKAKIKNYCLSNKKIKLNFVQFLIPPDDLHLIILHFLGGTMAPSAAIASF